eukprot:tig00001181_g7418.t1
MRAPGTAGEARLPSGAAGSAMPPTLSHSMVSEKWQSGTVVVEIDDIGPFETAAAAGRDKLIMKGANHPAPQVSSKLNVTASATRQRDYASAPLPDPRPEEHVLYLDAFLSFARGADAASAANLAAALQRYGLKCWYDGELPEAGGDIANLQHRKRLSAAIEGCACLVVLATKEWFSSPACATELRHAAWLGRKIVTLSLGGPSLAEHAATAGTKQALEAAAQLQQCEEIRLKALQGDEFLRALERLASEIRPQGTSVVEPDANVPIKPYDVMVSYRRKQTDEMRVVCELLKEKGISHWVDVNTENGILKGVQWGKAIAAAIKGSGVMLVLLTRDWLQSQYCIDASSGRRQKMCLEAVNTWQKVSFPGLLGAGPEKLAAARGSPAFEKAVQEMEEAITFDAEAARLHTQLTLRADKYKEALGFSPAVRWTGLDSVKLSKVPKENRNKAEGQAVDLVISEASKKEAENQKREAELQSKMAIENAELARQKEEEAQRQSKIATENADLARQKEAEAQQQSKIATENAELAKRNEANATSFANLASQRLLEVQLANQNLSAALNETETQRNIAIQQRIRADEQTDIANLQTDLAVTRLKQVGELAASLNVSLVEAEIQRRAAQTQAAIATERSSVSAAVSSSSTDPELALLFALDALGSTQSSGSPVATSAENTLRSILEKQAAEQYTSTGGATSAATARRLRRLQEEPAARAVPIKDFVAANDFFDFQIFSATSPNEAYSVLAAVGIIAPSRTRTAFIDDSAVSDPSGTFQLKLMAHVREKGGKLAYVIEDRLIGGPHRTSFWAHYLGAMRVMIDNFGDVVIHVRRLGFEKPVCQGVRLGCLPRVTGIALVYTPEKAGQRGCLKREGDDGYLLDIHDVFVGDGYVAFLTASSPFYSYTTTRHKYRDPNNIYVGRDTARFFAQLEVEQGYKLEGVWKGWESTRLYEWWRAVPSTLNFETNYCMANNPDLFHVPRKASQVALRIHVGRMSFLDRSDSPFAGLLPSR